MKQKQNIKRHIRVCIVYTYNSELVRGDVGRGKTFVIFGLFSFGYVETGIFDLVDSRFG